MLVRRLVILQVPGIPEKDLRVPICQLRRKSLDASRGGGGDLIKFMQVLPTGQAPC